MKHNIMGDKYLFGVKIKQFVTFYTNRVTNENTKSSFGVKFSSVCRQCRGKGKITKYLERRVVMNLFVKKLIRCFVANKRRRTSVNQKGSSQYTLRPKLNWNSRLKIESSSHIEQVLMLSFSNIILLRSFHTEKLMQHSLLSKKFSRGQFSSIIRSKHFDLFIKLIFNDIKELGNNMNHI